MLFIDYVNVLFSSNSQLYGGSAARAHVVYRLCQCSLFKQFTTSDIARKTAKSCLSIMSMFSFQAIHNEEFFDLLLLKVVYRLCQCSLFKQFTTLCRHHGGEQRLFIDYVNVLFSSNSQLLELERTELDGCLSIMSMFSFQAIHNFRILFQSFSFVVYRLCQCSLFKQFTTRC